MLYHLGMAWDLRWTTCQDNSTKFCMLKPNNSSEPVIPSIEQVSSVPQSFMEESLFSSLCKIYYDFRTVITISIEALNCFYCLLVVMAGYGVVLNFAKDAIAYEFARTIYSISKSFTSNFKL